MNAAEHGWKDKFLSVFIRVHLRLLIVLAVLLAGCQRNPAPKPVAEYQMRGEVLSLEPASQLATVKHEKIEGWMEAMTMEYPVKDKQEFLKLKVGEKIQAKIQVQGTDYWISSVNPDEAKPDQATPDQAKPKPEK